MSNLKRVLNAVGLEVVPTPGAATAPEAIEKAVPDQDEATSFEFATDHVATETVSTLSKGSCGC